MITDPLELVDAVNSTLTDWYLFHTDPEVWAEQWSNGGEYGYLLDLTPVIGNRYFKFDLLTACQIEIAINEWQLARCSNCGFRYSLLDGCDQEDGCDDAGYEELDRDEIEDYILDVGGADPNTIPEWLIKNVMIEQAFPVYSDGVGSLIGRVVDEIEDYYSADNQAETLLDRLIVAVNALQIMHVNGNIADDYGERFDLDYETVDIIRTEGLGGLFDAEILEEMVLEPA